MIILGIETSCDETAAAVCKDKRIISSVVSRQIIHERFGGVVPEVASREHEALLNTIVEKSLVDANIELTDLDPPNSYKITGSGNSPVGFASGEATVKLEDAENGTNLVYEVEANVGGKIVQVGSRLIDMTAKKMADIFFGK